jgi:hypothetical protein
MDVSADYSDRNPTAVLPDWTRMPLPVGAPLAVPKPAIGHVSPTTTVGA